MRTVSAALLLAFSAPGCTPAVTGDTQANEALLRIGEQAPIGGLTLRALRLVEDSRCPSNVQCIQAGTVRLAVRLIESGRSREALLELGRPEPIAGNRSLRLIAVCPARSDPVPPPARAYRFLIGTDAASDRSDCTPS